MFIPRRLDEFSALEAPRARGPATAKAVSARGHNLASILKENSQSVEAAAWLDQPWYLQGMGYWLLVMGAYGKAE